MPYVKDAFHAYVVNGDDGAVNPAQRGTKAAVRWQRDIPAGASATFRLRLLRASPRRAFRLIIRGDVRATAARGGRILSRRQSVSDQRRRAQHSAPSLRRTLWSKQWYHFVIRDWLNGDPAMPEPSGARRGGRNTEWEHLYSDEILSMPDKWEYPWFAAWDLAFHVVPFALIDPDFAKRQLLNLHARMVHAPQRSVARVRVGVRRCEPAGPRLGGVSRLQDRRKA